MPFPHVILCIRQFILAKNVICHHVSGLEHFEDDVKIEFQSQCAQQDINVQ